MKKANVWINRFRKSRILFQELYHTIWQLKEIMNINSQDVFKNHKQIILKYPEENHERCNSISYKYIIDKKCLKLI